MRVLGALEYAEGTTMLARYQAVSQMIFQDEDGHPRRFTWRTIQTWWYFYRRHGITDPPSRADKGTIRKVAPEQLATAIEKVLPHFHGAPRNIAVKLQPLAPDTLGEYIRSQLDRCGLPHHTFTDDALHLILRAVRNLCTAALIEAVRDRVKTVDLKQVNAVLMQPHWRHDTQGEPAQPLVVTNQKPRPK